MLIRPCGYFATPRKVQPIDVSTNHVWISEALLRTAFHRLSWLLSSRRHGSSVPGPLEARRRAARRRLMNLAPRSVGGAPDLTFLNGKNQIPDSMRWNWQPPTVSLQPKVEPRTEDGEKDMSIYKNVDPLC